VSFPEPIECGADWTEAQAVAVLLHGHGQTAEAMRELASAIDCPHVRYILPGADGAWYPRSLVESFEENEPALKQALARLGTIVDDARKRIALDRIVLGGYAEGACVVAEYLVRNPKSYGGALLLTGGLVDVAAIGRRPGSGLLAVPIYVSGSEMDAMIPVERTRGVIKTLQAGGALIRSHVFTDRAHEISPEEIFEAHKLLGDVTRAADDA
jgi:phospholipase/carboxylesterase